MKKRHSFLFLWILFQTTAWSQSQDWTVYTNSQHITAIASETDYIWAGTTGGLIRISKSSLEVSNFFTTANSDLPMNHITSIAVDAQGNKWIGTSGRGLVRFDGLSSFINYNRPQIPSDTVLTVNALGSTIRIGTTHGIAEFSGSAWSVVSGPNFLPSDTVTAMITGPTGHMVIGTQRGAVIFDGSVYINVTSNLPDPYITCVTVDVNDSAWVGMNYAGIAKRSIGAWRIYNMASTQNGLPSDMIRSITGDASGRIWIGTGTNGLVRFNNSQWTTFDTTNSAIPDNDVTALLAETTGDLWVGTRNGGIARFSGTAWTPVQITHSGLRDDAVLAAAVSPSGILWACGLNYVTHFDGTDWMTYTPEALGVFYGGFTNLLLDASGNPWVSTFEQGLFHFNGIQWINVTSDNTTGFPDNFINDMAVNPLNEDLWIATNNGVGHYNGTTWTTYNTISNEAALPYNVIRAIDVGSNGTVWIADDQSTGPLRFDQTNWTLFDASPTGISPGMISAIWVAESGNPWIGSQEDGIVHYTAGGWNYHQTTSNSDIPGDRVQSLEADADGNLWVGTTQGLGILSRPTTFTALFRTSDSSLPSNSIRSLAFDSQNRAYIATDSGLAVYRGAMNTASGLFIRNLGRFDFGNVSLSGQPVTMSSWALNTTTTPLSIDSLQWIENVPGAYAWLSPQLPYRVQANDSVFVSIRFTPTEVLFYAGQVIVFSNSASSPDTLFVGGSASANQVTAPFLLHPWQFSMISIPGILENTDIRSVLSSSLGPYSSTNWRVFYWRDGGYLELSDFSASDSLVFKPGIAFWLIPRDSAEIVLQNMTATPPIVNEGQFTRMVPYPIRLEPGWNMIGNPFAYPVSWNQIGQSDLVYRPVSYNGWYYSYQLEVMNPWEGYFVYNPQDTSVTLHVMPFTSVQKTSLRPLGEDEFFLDIEARGMHSGMRTSINRVGMLKTATDGCDAEDYPEAPPIGSYLRMNIIDEGNCYAGNYRETGQPGARWDIHVETNGQAETALLTFLGWDDLPDGFSIWLMEKNREMMIPVTAGQAAIAVPDYGKSTNFSLIIGTQAYAESAVHGIPLTPIDFALLPNVPNPFNPETVIEFHLPQKGDVHLEIFNIRGQHIRTLVHAVMSAGRHKAVWDGMDDSGRSAGSGIYICRIESSGFHAAHKMIMVR